MKATWKGRERRPLRVEKMSNGPTLCFQSRLSVRLNLLFVQFFRQVQQKHTSTRTDTLLLGTTLSQPQRIRTERECLQVLQV